LGPNEYSTLFINPAGLYPDPDQSLLPVFTHNRISLKRQKLSRMESGNNWGLIVDGFGVLKYYENPNSPNALGPGKALLNTRKSGLGFTGVGTIPSLMYFGIDAFYPGET